MEEGNHIILLIHGNSYMKGSVLSKALQDLSLVEAIMQRHGMNGPSTFRRNQTDNQIEGIWISPNSQVLQEGYLDNDEVFVNTNH